MRGEVLIGIGSLLSFAALLLLIFSHVGQINTSSVPRGIYMARVNVSGYGAALSIAFLNPIDDLYTSNASAPLQAEAGLRQFYKMGLYSHCGFVNETAGICSNTSAGYQYRPYDHIIGDMTPNYQFYSDAIIVQTTFRNSKYLGSSSRAAYYLILLGTICAALAFFSGLAKHNFTFLLSATFAGISSLFVLVGAAIWTVIIKKSDSINEIIIGTETNPSPLGITVSTGPGLYLVWAAFACLIASTVPYVVSCCTYRG
ncbi:hypothetical protein Moror_301 [Moniliophthora roreri MCA 2997]|uniref:Actin cortical patch SUR7/pH-response regulator PalI n=1 Tax=Moniliophthora roreri (strain MCA 2997) TaxID=1381753 RepID=V2Z2J8_MONRO|nr:hypothetical protein Moror_301 [Moniliophthora roreri MCA 2997]KAI3622519.1 hypothetical protein WG66_015618 [Moniliophthora roreri]